MRTKGILAIVTILLVCPLLGRAQSGFSGAYIGQVTTWERPVDQMTKEQNIRWYNRLILRYEPSKHFAVRTALRRADYFQEKTNSTDIYYGYIDWQPTDNLGFMVGRQYPFNKMIRRAIDGASAEWTLYKHWTLSGLMGAFAPTDRAGFIDDPGDNMGSYVALGYRGANYARAQASFYSQISNGRVMNFLGLDAKYPKFFDSNIYLFFKYNLTQNFVQEAQGQIRRQFGDKFAATVAYKYRDPNYDLPEWYWQFAIDPYSTLRLGLDYYMTTTGSLTFEYFSRYLSDQSIERYKFGWLASNWTAGVIFSTKGSQSSQEWRAYGSYQHHFGDKVLLGVGVNYFDYVFHEEYEEPLNAFGAQLFAKYRFLDNLTAGLRGYYLTNAEFSEDVRLIGELSYQF